VFVCTKIKKIISQVRSLMAQNKVPIKELQSLVGRLLWLTSAWHYLRPLFIPLYKALGRLPVTMIGMDHVVFQCLVSNLSSDLVLRVDLTHQHHSLAKDVTLVRVANTHVKALTEVQNLHLRSRRIWIGVLDPNSPHRLLEDDAHSALAVWERLFTSTSFSLSMTPPVRIELTATADAMATNMVAGIGGAVFFPNGSCHWFQFQIHLDEAMTLWDWVESDMQKHIAAWELLAQYALTFCIHTALPTCRTAISCIQGTDNSAADAASAKGWLQSWLRSLLSCVDTRSTPGLRIFLDISTTSRML